MRRLHPALWLCLRPDSCLNNGPLNRVRFYFEDGLILEMASAKPLPICAMIFAEPL
jgi:hypothetical protein